MDEKRLMYLRRAVIGCAVGILIAVLVTATPSPQVQTELSVEEQVFCVSAICIDDPQRGKQCIDFTPRISKLISIPDVESKSVRIALEATGRVCKEPR